MHKHGQLQSDHPPCPTCPKYQLCPNEEGGWFGLKPENFLAKEIYDLAAQPNFQSVGLGGLICTGTLDKLAAFSVMDQFKDELPTKFDRRLMLQKLNVIDSMTTESYQQKMTQQRSGVK